MRAVLAGCCLLALLSPAVDAKKSRRKKADPDASELQKQVAELLGEFNGDKRLVREAVEAALTEADSKIGLPLTSVDDVFHSKYIIIGAGPAGIQLAYYMKQKARDYLVLEKGNSPGMFYKTYPRHRQLISINKRYAGPEKGHEFHLRHDWNSLISDDPTMLMKSYSDEYYPPADSLVTYLNDFAAKNELRIRYDTSVTVIKRPKGEDVGFELIDDDGNKFTCDYLIDAMGLGTTNTPKGMVGAEHVEDYSVFNTDPKNYTNQKVLILGKGNAAFETATAIMPEAAEVYLISRNPLRLAPFTHYPGDLRVVNDEALGAYQLKSLVSILDTDAPILNTSIKMTVEYNADGFWKDSAGKGIRPYRFTHERVGGPPEMAEQLYRKRTSLYDRVIMSVGFIADVSPYGPSARPVMDYRHKYPKSDATYRSENVAGLYFAGTRAHYRDWRKSSGGFIHGFRYTARALQRWMDLHIEGAMWPMKAVKLHPKTVTEAIMQRMGESSGLYQMFQEFCDLIVVGGSPLSKYGTHAGYLEEVPMRMVPELLRESAKLQRTWKPAEGERVQFYTVRLEYHRCFKDEAVITRHLFCSNPTCYAQTNLIHPVIRYYDLALEDLGRLGEEDMDMPLREFHITEDLNTDWKDRDMFWLPTATFVASSLGMTQSTSIDVPYNIAERDVTLPLQDCELSKAGDLLFTKYEKLVDTNQEMAHFFLLQALKFKPELAQKTWDGKELKDVVALGTSGAGISKCTTPEATVQECIDGAVMEQAEDTVLQGEGVQMALDEIHKAGILTEEQYNKAIIKVNSTTVPSMPESEGDFGVLNGHEDLTGKGNAHWGWMGIDDISAWSNPMASK